MNSKPLLVGVLLLALSGCQTTQTTQRTQEAVAPQSSITVSSAVPSELNPSVGGPATATPSDAANFAWQEFIALNWPAGTQAGQPGQRDTPSSTCRFGDPNCTGPLTWETFRGKVETFPGNASPFNYQPPPGFLAQTGIVLGYDALPVYNYTTMIPPVVACDASQANDPTPWINLDETDEITLTNMHAGVVQTASSPGNSAPTLIRFLAKANRSMYVYVARNSSRTDPMQQWWFAIPKGIVTATKAYLAKNQASPPADSSMYISLPNNTIEAKAAWRPLNPAEVSSGRFHVQKVRFYEGPKDSPCWRDATWGLVALHIIQKTPMAPYFIYATFEQADNILSATGTPVEDANGNIVQPEPATSTNPQVCLMDPRPPSTPPPPTPPGEVTSQSGSVILTANPSQCTPAPSTAYCTSAGSQLYIRNVMVAPPNSSNSEPSAGNICITKRENAIPDYAIAANTQAHAAIAAYLKGAGIASAPWLAYKLVNVQYFPYDKVIQTVTPNGSLYTSQPPYSAKNPAPSSFYQANIVVETNRSLQLFSGGLSPNISSDWNQDGTPHKNTFYGGGAHNMGGCMGCHGSQGQNPDGQAGDFSVILARGSVSKPEVPAPETSAGRLTVPRNRSLRR